jgi:hypothetical protein
MVQEEEEVEDKGEARSQDPPGSGKPQEEKPAEEDG